MRQRNWFTHLFDIVAIANKINGEGKTVLKRKEIMGGHTNTSISE